MGINRGPPAPALLPLPSFAPIGFDEKVGPAAAAAGGGAWAVGARFLFSLTLVMIS